MEMVQTADAVPWQMLDSEFFAELRTQHVRTHQEVFFSGERTILE